jgi:glyoxylase-like metal-dependent hydrolase (beta-lactamase superfamily II)
MRRSPATPNIVRLTRFGFVNAYLVREDGGLTLVDTMVGGSAKGIAQAAAALGAPITRVALTHAHADHVGSQDAVMQALGDVELSASAREARLLAGDRRLDPGEPQSKLAGGWTDVAARVTRELSPGDRVGSLEVVAAPGHTPGHVAFLDTRDRTLIAGDAFSTLGGVATTARANPRFPLPAMATWDRPTVLRSARALRALEPARLAVGHGPVVEDPLAAMDGAIARAAIRLEPGTPEARAAAGR